MFLAVELQMSGVYVSNYAVGLFKPSKSCIRTRKIAQRGENNMFRCAINHRRERLAAEIALGNRPRAP